MRKKLVSAFAASLATVLSAVAQAPPFATIDVSPAHSTSVESTRIRVFPNGDLLATSVNAIALLSFAYNVPANPSDRLSILPDWAHSQRYDIDAKATKGAKGISSSDAVSGESVRRMFRQILADRFHLALRAESKIRPVYALVVAPGGPKLKRSPPSDCVYDTLQPEGCHAFAVAFGHPLNAQAVTMDDLAYYIENWTDLPVVNKTALGGFFITNSEGWLPMRLPPPPPNGAGNVDFTHLQSIDAVLGSLGLKLRRDTASIPIYKVEKIEQPSAHH